MFSPSHMRRERCGRQNSPLGMQSGRSGRQAMLENELNVALGAMSIPKKIIPMLKRIILLAPCVWKGQVVTSRSNFLSVQRKSDEKHYSARWWRHSYPPTRKRNRAFLKSLRQDGFFYVDRLFSSLSLNWISFNFLYSPPSA